MSWSPFKRYLTAFKRYLTAFKRYLTATSNSFERNLTAGQQLITDHQPEQNVANKDSKRTLVIARVLHRRCEEVLATGTSMKPFREKSVNTSCQLTSFDRLVHLRMLVSAPADKY